MTEFNRCFGCMREKQENDGPCPYCGYDIEAPQESTMYINPGTLLNNRYVIGKALGQGGFGITYIAWDATLNCSVAIKEYLPLSIASRNSGSILVSCASNSLKNDYEFGLKKFLDEARTLAMFGSTANIVNVKDFFEANGTAYMVMEYLDGIDFKKYLERAGGSISWQRAEEILIPVGNALEAVHAKKLLHRDVSPDNIYITSSGQVKLLDFGAARVALGVQNKSVSVTLKHGYAPFEQYKTKATLGAWTDEYALAATYYRAITGKLPPDAVDRLEKDELVPPSKLGIDFPADREAVLLKALSINARDRFQTVKGFMDAMQLCNGHNSKTMLYNASATQLFNQDKTVTYRGDEISNGDQSEETVRLSTRGVNEPAAECVTASARKKRQGTASARKIIFRIAAVVAVGIGVFFVSQQVDFSKFYAALVSSVTGEPTNASSAVIPLENTTPSEQPEQVVQTVAPEAAPKPATKAPAKKKTVAKAAKKAKKSRVSAQAQAEIKKARQEEAAESKRKNRVKNSDAVVEHAFDMLDD